jgi:hypothetical protein
MNTASQNRSERLYERLLKLYPRGFRREYGEEMKYVFAERLKDAYGRHGAQGVLAFWRRTLVDAVMSSISQHLNNQEGRDTMKPNFTTIVMQNKVFAWIALATGLLLLIPLVAMQFSSGVNWTAFDFVVMGALLFFTGSLFVLAARRLERKYWLAVGFVVGLAFLYLWAELAVGIFTNWGS